VQEREEEDMLQGTTAAVQESEEENARQRDARLGLREKIYRDAETSSLASKRA
jgi:hypothetical protein